MSANPVDAKALTDEELLAVMRHWHANDEGDRAPLMAEVRERCPVVHSEEAGGFYLLSRYDDILAAFQDPETFSATTVSIPPSEDQRGKLIPNNIDPPDHTAYRRLLAGWFTPRVVHGLEDSVRERVRGYLETFAEAGGGDFISDVAVPFPCVTMMIILGLPLKDLDQLLEWKDAMIRDLLSNDPVRMEHVANVIVPAIAGYLGGLIDERESDPDAPDDILTAVSRGLFEAPGLETRPLSREEKILIMQFLFVAGLDTVTSQLGFVVHYLARHPEHRQQLIDHPELIPNSVEEFFRFFPVAQTARRVMKDVELGGVHIEAGAMVCLLLDSSGRDALFYDEDPEMVDFERKNIRHLALGAGIHRCLGSHIARMEMRVAIEELLRVMPNFRIDESVEIKSHTGAVMGIDQLGLIVEPA